MNQPCDKNDLHRLLGLIDAGENALAANLVRAMLSAPSAIAPNVVMELLRVAQCPACDGSGAIPHQIGEGDWELQQCQWCDERRQAVGPSDGSAQHG